MTTSEEAARIALRERLGKGARYDAAAAPAQTLSWARRGTAYFARKLNELTDIELDAPALLPGLSRRHVIAMVGYQARNLALDVEGARLGVPNAHLAPAERQEQIALGATLPARALRNLFAHAEVHLNVEWRDLGDADWDKTVPDAEGHPMPMRQTAWLRARLIWIAAVDLGNGGSFRDFPPDYLDALVAETPRALLPTIELIPTNRSTSIRIGVDPATTVEGSMADLARWLTGRGAERVHVSGGGDAPVIPRWI